MTITASIVTYNSGDEILVVLDSLVRAGLNQSNIYVVDNASSDNTVSIIKEHFDGVKIFESKTNLGYGGGHNLAINNIESDYHIIVNPDIMLEANSLEEMINFMNSNTDVVLLSPKVLNTDMTVQHLPKRKPTFKFCVCGRLPFKSAKKVRNHYTMADLDIQEPLEIDFCTGCFMFCRTSVLKEVRGFDERYFMYFEDADLTLKMKQFGKTIYYPSAYVVHKWKRESKTNKKLLRIHIESMFKFLKKWKKYGIKK